MQGGGGGGRRSVASIECPKSMVGRIIGRNGETIKSLQTYTGSLIQIDQRGDPVTVTISGNPQSLQLALSICHDIIKGTFKGFALLRQAGNPTGAPARPTFSSGQVLQRPVYAPGYGLIPPSQLYGGADLTTGQMVVPSFGPRPLQTAGFAFTPTGAPVVLGLQPMQLAQAPTAGGGLQQVYNLSGVGGYTGPVYYPPGASLDFSNAGLQPVSDGSLYYQDPSLLGAGSSLVTSTDMSMRGVGASAKLLQAAAGASKAAGPTRTLDTAKMAVSQDLLTAAAGPSAQPASLVNPGNMPSLVVDGDGQLYAYTRLDT